MLEYCTSILSKAIITPHLLFRVMSHACTCITKIYVPNTRKYKIRLLVEEAEAVKITTYLDPFWYLLLVACTCTLPVDGRRGKRKRKKKQQERRSIRHPRNRKAKIRKLPIGLNYHASRESKDNKYTNCFRIRNTMLKVIFNKY